MKNYDRIIVSVYTELGRIDRDLNQSEVYKELIKNSTVDFWQQDTFVRFGEKYKQWNAAFDAGYAAALGKSLIVMHNAEHQHALKEVDAAALAIAETPEQIVQILRYVLNGSLPR